MYRLVLYYLIVLAIFGLFVQGPLLIFTAAFILAGAYLGNKLFAWAFKVQPNFESIYISALILILIVSPAKTIHDLPFIFWAVVWMVGSKFIFAARRKHFFNPVAIGVLLPALFLGQSATWWIGTNFMFIPVLVGGLLIARKIQRLEMVFTLLAVNLIVTHNLAVILHSALFFFAFVMFTEPMTTPPTRKLRFIYAVITGILLSPHIAAPETALIIGNVFSYLVSSKEKLLLTLQEKIKLTADTYDFIFSPDRKFNFIPGQYLEWTLVHPKADSRGERRFFTIASSPTENNLHLGVKFPAGKISSYKTALLNVQPGDQLLAGTLTGDFTLPKNTNLKLTFVAGGIGITPFRSMVKYLADTNQNRDIILLYSSANDFVYQDIFAKIKTIYKVGRIEEKEITDMPFYHERIYFISGPHVMVVAIENILKKLGVPSSQVHTDYFPGY